MFRCCSLETSHPRLLPQSLKDCSINLCLLFLNTPLLLIPLIALPWKESDSCWLKSTFYSFYSCILEAKHSWRKTSGLILNSSSQISSRSPHVDNVSYLSSVLKLLASPYFQSVILLLLSLIKQKKWEDTSKFPSEHPPTFASKDSAIPLRTMEASPLLLSEANHSTWIWVFLLDFSSLSLS